MKGHVLDLSLQALQLVAGVSSSAVLPHLALFTSESPRKSVGLLVSWILLKDILLSHLEVTLLSIG